jgi:beta-aspartyl-dipeptidase (metallo-type)
MAGKIAAIEDNAEISWKGGEVQVIDGTGCLLTPGFVDPHVHILGGGGEGGCHTRAPEVRLSECVKAGSTTVVGLLGTDGYTRDMVGLLGKAKGLEEEGISTYLFSGCYRIPSATLTGDIIHDLITVDKILGPGEVAISDHRSSQPSYDEIKRLVADARVGGMISGKAGITHFHLGDGEGKLDPLFRILAETEIPIAQMYPTHVSRNPELFLEAIRFAKLGGPIDMTPTTNPELWERLYGEVRVSRCFKQCLEAGVSDDLVTFSSDGHGSQPIFDENMNYAGMEVAALDTPYLEVVSCVRDLGIPMETALKTITSNPARILKLKGKGRIETGYDADLCLIDGKTLELTGVIAGGKVLMQDKELLVKGTFE